MYKQAEIDSGDIGYGVLGGLLGGGAGWLLGRLIHGDRYKRNKLRQLFFALSGMAAGGGFGTLYGKTLSNKLFGPESASSNEENTNPEGKTRGGKKTTAKDLKYEENKPAHKGTRIGGTAVGGVGGAGVGSWAGGGIAKLRFSGLPNWKNGVNITLNNGKIVTIKDPDIAAGLINGRGFHVNPATNTVDGIVDTNDLAALLQKQIPNVYQLDDLGKLKLSGASKQLGDQAQDLLNRKMLKYKRIGAIGGGIVGTIGGNIGGKIVADRLFPIKDYATTR